MTSLEVFALIMCAGVIATAAAFVAFIAIGLLVSSVMSGRIDDREQALDELDRATWTPR